MFTGSARLRRDTDSLIPWFLCLCLLLPGVCLGGRTIDDRLLIVHVDLPPQPWHVPQLESKLIRRLTRHQNGCIMSTGDLSGNGPGLPQDLYSADSLISYGREVGGQFVLMVAIDREGLETRKGFHLPLVFHQYRAYGIIEGEMRLVDVSRRKLLIAEPIRIEQKGPRIFQATMDDDINDPDLHLTASAKLRFFERIEEKLAVRLARRVADAIRLR
ncbi:MAG: hypothetical protein AB1744_03440 [Candidatus Zixiibacteriota bacterium]